MGLGVGAWVLGRAAQVVLLLIRWVACPRPVRRPCWRRRPPRPASRPWKPASRRQPRVHSACQWQPEWGLQSAEETLRQAAAVSAGIDSRGCRRQWDGGWAHALYSRTLACIARTRCLHIGYRAGLVAQLVKVLREEAVHGATGGRASPDVNRQRQAAELSSALSASSKAAPRTPESAWPAREAARLPQPARPPPVLSKAVRNRAGVATAAAANSDGAFQGLELALPRLTCTHACAPPQTVLPLGPCKPGLVLLRHFQRGVGAVPILGPCYLRRVWDGGCRCLQAQRWVTACAFWSSAPAFARPDPDMISAGRWSARTAWPATRPWRRSPPPATTSACRSPRPRPAPAPARCSWRPTWPEPRELPGQPGGSRIL